MVARKLFKLVHGGCEETRERERERERWGIIKHTVSGKFADQLCNG